MCMNEKRREGGGVEMRGKKKGIGREMRGKGE